MGDQKSIDMEEISQTIQLLSEETLSKISKGPLVKFIREYNDVENLSRLWQSLLKTFSTASTTSAHTTASCNALSAFLDAASVSKCEGTRQLAQSPETWLSAFEVYMSRFEDAKPKPMKQVLNSLVKILAKIQQDPNGKSIQSSVVDAILPSIILGEPRARLKASLVSLEIIMRKSAILPHDLISMLESWLAKNGERWTPLLQDSCRALSMDITSFLGETLDGTRSDDSKGTAVQILLLGLLNQAKNPELASGAGDTMAAFFQKLKTDPLLSVWVEPVRHTVLQNIDILEPMSNYILQPLFTLDPSGFSAFLERLPLPSVYAGDMANAPLEELTVLFASLQVGKKIGRVHEDYIDSKSNQQSSSKIPPLPSDIIGQFLFHKEFNIRIAALSLLISAPATTRPLSSATIRAILCGLPSMHAESDSYSRGETLSLIRKLIVRLKGGIMSNQAGLDHESSSTTNQQAKSDRNDSETRACLKAYVDFLKADMRPNASYPRHIMALKTMILFLESGLDSRINFNKAAKMEGDKVRWKFNLDIFEPGLLRLLVDLLLDPFEEVRATSLTILNFFPRDFLLSGLVQSTNESSGMPLRLTEALIRAEQLASNTSRADHADTVARLYHIIFCAAAQTNQVGFTQWWGTKKGVVDLVLKKLEGKLSISEGLFTPSMRDAPLHGYVSALRYIVSTPNFYQLIADEQISSQDHWREFHTRLVCVCDRIWEGVKPVLCIDSPEGHSDEPTEEFNIGPKDILSYSWRALRESRVSLLLHATLANPTYAPKGELGFNAADYEKIGMSSFTQLAELRHRGAFSTVSQTFATCCQRCGQSSDPAISSLPYRWYQEAKKIIFEAASQLTRRSAGLPALATGILLSKPGGPLFQQVMDELHEVSHLPAEQNLSKQKFELPQVHAMNCLKDIFTNTKLGPYTEPYIMPALTLSAERLGSPIWALRNSGLMLFRALLTRICRLLTGTGFGFGGSSGSEPGARISFHKYPGLLQLLSNLLAPAGKKQNSELIENDIVTERVFPALELIAEKVPSVSDEDDVLLQTLVREQFKSPVWGIREHAARVYASLLKRSDILQEIRTLLDVDRESTSQDFLHGKALCAKYALRRFASISLSFWNNHLVEVSSTLHDIFAALFPSAHSPFVATTLVEILDDAVEKCIESGAENSAVQLLANAFDTFGFHDILAFVFDSSNPSWKTLSTTRATSLLRRVLSWTAILRMFVSGQLENSAAFFLTVSTLDSNAGRWVIEQLQNVLGDKERYRNSLLAFYSSVILGEYAAEVKSVAISSLEAILRVVLDSRSSDVKDINLPWDALHAQIDTSETWNRDMADAELRLQGCLLTVRASLNHWKPLERDLQRWATRLRFAMQEETEYTTRYSAVTSVATFGRILRPVGSPPQVDPVFLEIYLILYDMLNDDDEELREIAAATASWVISYSSVSPSKSVTLAPLYASELFSRFLVENYPQSSVLCTTIMRYMTGEAPRISGSVDTPEFRVVADQLQEQMKESTILFEEEKQNLFIDDVREIDDWSARLLQMTGSSFNTVNVQGVATWVHAGLAYMSAFITEERGKDGLLGWASKPETFTLGVRVISLAGVLVSQNFAAAEYLGETRASIKTQLEAFLDQGQVGLLHSDWCRRIQQALQSS
ncbi:THADA/TRM732 family protein [Aspergillus clavatus NRRL 1]|uniref:HEAT repeat protein n=1 Tax=Aspergillus clavatus (strain ATCC 1007 / CBS 513.65 / DSM 816 / NCTC 3887 / NRRL 1 / QM 1276 / 107) TaxID=344612 RepID=A1C7D7_ASPCL|nr:HEAT repeat protein [Aspergillus clavatus NRRL 1]EAW14308.1 HEAT repeat protein [Aspergillus clavatus NRRL 1]